MHKGIVLDQSLSERSVVPDAALHQISAKEGFANEPIHSEATRVMSAVKTALRDDSDLRFLAPLENLLHGRLTPAHEFIEKYNNGDTIEKTIKNMYQPLGLESSPE